MEYEVIVPTDEELTELVLPTILGYREIDENEPKELIKDK